APLDARDRAGCDELVADHVRLAAVVLRLVEDACHPARARRARAHTRRGVAVARGRNRPLRRLESRTGGGVTTRETKCCVIARRHGSRRPERAPPAPMAP